MTAPPDSPDTAGSQRPPGAPRTLAAVLARHAGQRPDAVAIEFDGRVLSYAALARASRSLAARLWHDEGVRPGDRVAWLGLNHPHQLVLLFALARIGAILLPLNVRLAPAEWDALITECQPRHLVHDTALAPAAQALAGRHGLTAGPADTLEDAPPGRRAVVPAVVPADVPVEAFAEASAPAFAAPDQAAPDAPVLLVYSSGTTSSTGRAKAAVHTQGMLLAGMAMAAGVQAMTPRDLILTVLPLYHVGGLCIQTLPALYAGATVLLHPRFDAGAVLAAIGGRRPSLTLQVPATMKALAEHARWQATDMSGLRAVWAGSSLLPPALIEAFHARGIPVCNVYGATETGPFSIALPPAQAFDRVGSCGWPAPGVEVRLKGAAAVGAGELLDSAGELLIRAPNVVRHYWPRQPACDADGWFHTGDLALRAADGSYSIVGRARDLIISGGENIDPAEIEALLAEHPSVAECAAFGLPDAQWGEVVAVAVVLAPGAIGSDASDAQLQAFLAARLARFKLPRRWLRLEALPRTALGKLRRRELARLIMS